MLRVNVSGDSRMLLMCAKMQEIQDRRVPVARDNLSIVCENLRVRSQELNANFHEMVARQDHRQRVLRARFDRIIAKEPKTKLEQAFVIYQAMAGKATRKQIIDLIMTSLDMTKAGAASYYGQARNKYDAAVDAHEYVTIAA